MTQEKNEGKLQREFEARLAKLRSRRFASKRMKSIRKKAK